MLKLFGSEKRDDHSSAVSSGCSSSRLVVHDPPSTSSAIAVTERFDTSLRGCSSTTSVMSSQSIRTLPAFSLAVSNNSSSFTPSVVYNFSNCTVHHVGSSIPNSSSSSDV